MRYERATPAAHVVWPAENTGFSPHQIDDNDNLYDWQIGSDAIAQQPVSYSFSYERGQPLYYCNTIQCTNSVPFKPLIQSTNHSYMGFSVFTGADHHFDNSLFF